MVRAGATALLAALIAAPSLAQRKADRQSQQMAGHESERTTGLYDLRNDSMAPDEVERVVY